MRHENFNDAEALKIAINIEEEGLDFYSLLMKSAKNDKAKDIFSKLASAEKKHLALFQEMYSKITSPSNPAQGCEDYTVDLYLKDLIETGVFTKKGEARRLATEIKTDIDALKIGIQAEKDSILYYTEAVKNTRHEGGKKAFEQLTDEEWISITHVCRHRRRRLQSTARPDYDLIRCAYRQQCIKPSIGATARSSDCPTDSKELECCPNSGNPAWVPIQRDCHQRHDIFKTV